MTLNNEGLAELIERVERSTGPDRDIDARLAVLSGEVVMRGSVDRGFAFFEAPVEHGQWAFLSGCKRGEDAAYTSLGQCLSIPKPYTASTDAALALTERVLPGHDWIIGHTNGGLTIHCQIGSRAPEDMFFGASAPLAIILATLHALHKQATT